MQANAPGLPRRLGALYVELICPRIDDKTMRWAVRASAEALAEDLCKRWPDQSPQDIFRGMVEAHAPPIAGLEEVAEEGLARITRALGVSGARSAQEDQCGQGNLFGG